MVYEGTTNKLPGRAAARGQIKKNNKIQREEPNRERGYSHSFAGATLLHEPMRLSVPYTNTTIAISHEHTHREAGTVSGLSSDTLSVVSSSFLQKHNKTRDVGGNKQQQRRDIRTFTVCSVARLRTITADVDVDFVAERSVSCRRINTEEPTRRSALGSSVGPGSAAAALARKHTHPNTHTHRDTHTHTCTHWPTQAANKKFS